MRVSDIVLELLFLSPHLYTVYHVLLKLTQPDYFTLISFISLTALALSRYSPAILLSLIFVPSAVCFGLFVMGYPPPLIGLAAGYIIALPLYIILGTHLEKKIENITISYLLALALNIAILYSSEASSRLTPPDIIVNLLVRVPKNIVNGGRFALSYPANDVFTILTATSCIALFFIIFRRQKRGFPTSSGELTPLIISASVILFVSVISRLWMYSSIVTASSILILLISLSIILRVEK